MGIVQGLTEFLPVSSSGHLIIVPYLAGWNDPFITSLAFSVMLHIGTLAALLVYFRSDWMRLIPAGLATIRDRSFDERSGSPARMAHRRGDDSRPHRRRASQRPRRAALPGSRPRGADARRRWRHPVARRAPGIPPIAGGRPDVPEGAGDRRRPGTGARAGNQPVRDLDLGGAVRRAGSGVGRALLVPHGDADHRRRRGLRDATRSSRGRRDWSSSWRRSSAAWWPRSSRASWRLRCCCASSAADRPMSSSSTG